MLKQTDILQAVTALLKSRYQYEIYADEVKQGFKQPCFFIKFIKRKTTQNKSYNSNSFTIILSYFASKKTSKEVEFMEVVDEITELFSIGFHAGSRYLHVDTVSDEKIGEDQDILQISIDLPYFDTTGYEPDAGFDKMQEINIRYNLKS